MQALENDFIVLNALEKSLSLSTKQIQTLAERKLGIGFDQCLILEPAKNSHCAFHYRIFNADGSESEQCGNGARALALYIHKNKLALGNEWRLSTKKGEVTLQFNNQDHIAINMGEPQFHTGLKSWLHVDGNSLQVTCVDMGNPHVVYQVQQLMTEPVGTLGPLIATHTQFPAGTNVEFVQILADNRMALRTYERGVGETSACGSGACAAMAAMFAQGLVEQKVLVEQRGGTLEVEWLGPGHSLWMVGPARFVFEGIIDIL